MRGRLEAGEVKMDGSCDGFGRDGGLFGRGR